jgi:hypothetical protein
MAALATDMSKESSKPDPNAAKSLGTASASVYRTKMTSKGNGLKYFFRLGSNPSSSALTSAAALAIDRSSESIVLSPAGTSHMPCEADPKADPSRQERPKHLYLSLNSKARPLQRRTIQTCVCLPCLSRECIL